MSQNTIKREISIQASQAQIFAAITDPEQLVKWFPDTVEGNLQPDNQAIFGFGEHGKNQVYVVACNPHDYFAYRWVPATHFLGDVLSVPNTLVEFHISEQSNGACHVTVTESGFADLPAATKESSFKQNSGGWDFMMDRLTQYMNSQA